MLPEFRFFREKMENSALEMGSMSMQRVYGSNVAVMNATICFVAFLNIPQKIVNHARIRFVRGKTDK